MAIQVKPRQDKAGQASSLCFSSSRLSCSLLLYTLLAFSLFVLHPVFTYSPAWPPVFVALSFVVLSGVISSYVLFAFVVLMCCIVCCVVPSSLLFFFLRSSTQPPPIPLPAPFFVCCFVLFSSALFCSLLFPCCLSFRHRISFVSVFLISVLFSSSLFFVYVFLYFFRFISFLYHFRLSLGSDSRSVPFVVLVC